MPPVSAWCAIRSLHSLLAPLRLRIAAETPRVCPSRRTWTTLSGEDIIRSWLLTHIRVHNERLKGMGVVGEALVGFSEFLEREVLGIPIVGFLKPGIKLRELLVVGHRIGVHEEPGLAKLPTREMRQR